ncbi:RNA polymerase sigma factor [Aquimarina sp. AU474]|uniref:RNA polymerase sigma factor n=1 Tax=Aquimarina sp. AU474 TaxID=2108529 RepID=UPI000D689FAA|nr:RNA polymerase sigma factor [Aquimarina sp. AU474]
MNKKTAHKVFDSLLVLQCQSGNKKAMALLVKRWHARLCKHAYWYTYDIEISKDIVQDSWSKILLKISTLKDPNSFGSWALTIVTRNAINWLRKHKKELTQLKEYRDQHDIDQREHYTSNSENVLVQLKKEIKKLPNEQQIVLNLFYLEEYSVKQISDIVHVSTGTVKSRLFTAREKLKLILKNKYDEK